MKASSARGRDPLFVRPHRRTVVPAVFVHTVRKWLTGPGARRSRLFDDLWIDLKCYAAPDVRDITLSRIRGFGSVHVAGPVGHHSPLVVTALAMLLQSDTIFEFGPDSVDTTSLLTHNLPSARIFWLDEHHRRPADPPRGPFDGVYPLPTRDEGVQPDPNVDARITRFTGDADSFNLVPYSRTADFVYIDAGKRCEHVAADTDAAFGVLSELGCIVWDGYSGDTCVYAYLNRLARELDGPIYHIRGTRLAFYSRWDLVFQEAE